MLPEDRDISREMKDLISSPGWEELRERLNLRKEAAIKNLVTAGDFISCARFQSQVKEIEALLNFPHQVIQEIRRKEGSNA